MTHWIFGNLAASALLIAVVLLLRRPVAKAFGARAAFALWIAPLLRLLMPPLPVDAPAPAILIETRDAAVQVIAPVQAAFPLGALLVSIWAIGAVTFLALHLWAYAKFVRRALADGTALPGQGNRDTAIIETSVVTGPAAAGLRTRRVFVPRGFAEVFDDEERRLALRHEMLHHRRGDLWASATSLAVLALHWFNPLAYVAHRAFRRDLEAACDADLLAGADAAERQLYARTILRCAARSIPQPVCALTDTQELKGRLEMMKRDIPFARRMCGGALVMAVAAGGVFLSMPASAQLTKKDGAQERVEARKVVIHGTDGEIKDAELSPEMKAKIAKCDGEKFETEANVSAPGKVQRSRILICGKPGESREQMAQTLEKALGSIESEDAISAEARTKIAADLRARIAELRAGK